MTAPEFEVTTDEGDILPFASLYAEGPFALIFLRHLGCILCLQHVRDLARHPELPVVFVSRSSPEETRRFHERMNSPHRFLSDPEGKLHAHFGIARGGYGQIFNAHTLKAGMKAVFSGLSLGRPESDPMELGGAFVIDRRGEVTWEQRAKDAADNVSAETIATELGKVEA